MIGDLLLWLIVSDLRQYSDNELREFLQLLVQVAGSDESEVSVHFQDAIVAQLESSSLDRDALTAWPDDYAELLPEGMARYEEAMELFEQGLDELVVRSGQDGTSRLAKFYVCRELVRDGKDWQSKSEAARAIATLEEEIFAIVDEQERRPITRIECSPVSVVAHRYLLEGVDVWQEAFRLTHKGKLEEAWQCAQEADQILRAVTDWKEKAFGAVNGLDHEDIRPSS